MRGKHLCFFQSRTVLQELAVFFFHRTDVIEKHANLCVLIHSFVFDNELTERRIQVTCHLWYRILGEIHYFHCSPLLFCSLTKIAQCVNDAIHLLHRCVRQYSIASLTFLLQINDQLIARRGGYPIQVIGTRIERLPIALKKHVRFDHHCQQGMHLRQYFPTVLVNSTLNLVSFGGALQSLRFFTHALQFQRDLFALVGIRDDIALGDSADEVAQSVIDVFRQLNLTSIKSVFLIVQFANLLHQQSMCFTRFSQELIVALFERIGFTVLPLLGVSFTCSDHFPVSKACVLQHSDRVDLIDGFKQLPHECAIFTRCKVIHLKRIELLGKGGVVRCIGVKLLSNVAPFSSSFNVSFSLLC